MRNFGYKVEDVEKIVYKISLKLGFVSFKHDRNTAEPRAVRKYGTTS